MSGELRALSSAAPTHNSKLITQDLTRSTLLLRLALGSCAAVAAMACVVGVHAQTGTATAPSRLDATRFAQKLVVINQPKPALRASSARRTPVTEREVNAYLAYDAGNQIPMGIVQPSISILGDGRVAGRAWVDLDTVRRMREPRSLLDPLRYMSGRLEVTASGLLRTREGVAHFDLESAAISGVTVPKLVLQELLSAYSRTPEDSDGLGLDDPFALPTNIREIEVGRGQAIVVQ